MKKAMIAAIAALSVAAVYAQDFGSEAGAVESAAIAEVQQVMEEDVEPAVTALDAINDYFNSKDDWNKGYDEENDRIIVIEHLSFDIKNPEVSTDFVELRKEKMSELLLKAKSKIIEQIMSKMSGSRILEIPGNPIAKQVEKEQKEINNQIKVSLKELAKLDAEFAEAAERRDGFSSSELLATISSWFTSAEKENVAEKYDADKKERYLNAKKDFEAAQAAHAELLEKAEELKGTISKEMKTSLSRVSEMPIYGCTILQQAESITEKNGKYAYQIAIIYSWSGDMQEASGAILKGESVTFAPGKRSIKQWLAKKAENGALSQWCGPRQYIDNKGHMWFLGIACAPLSGDSDEDDGAREAAELEAAAEVMFALYADASSSKTLNKLMQTVRGADGEKQDKIYKDFSKTQSESFKDIQISGNGEMYSGVQHHAPSGLDMCVVVYGVSSGNQKALRDIQTRATALGIEVNTAQEQERGRQAQMKKSFEASKTNAAARAAGAAQAKQELAAEAAKAKARRAARKNAGFKASQGRPSGNAVKGKLRAGSAMIIDDDDE